MVGDGLLSVEAGSSKSNMGALFEGTVPSRIADKGATVRTMSSFDTE